jgi:hypothetical protein
MKKKIIATALIFTAISVQAQVKLPEWLTNVKLSGYGMMQYQASNEDGAKSNTFNLRIARISLDGRIANDFYWKFQMQVNGNTTTLGNSPKIVDCFTEWQKFNFLRIKVGQFKRAFTFENPMTPIDQGFMSYGEVINNLAGFNDRNGSHSSNGRDIGVQVQGDFLKNGNGRNLLHYQVGIYNGQGINVKDVDQQKDIIGGLWLMPVQGMRIGAFGWTGSYARKGTSSSENITTPILRRLQQRRYALSAEYKAEDWTFRSEYIHSTGYAFKTRYQKEDDASDITLSSNGDKAQGAYALVIVPIIKNKLHAKARYDMYQPTGNASRQRTQYDAGIDYEFNRNWQINAEYAYVHDRSLPLSNASYSPDYSIIDVEVDFKF